LLIGIYGSSVEYPNHVVGKFLLQGLECYKDGPTQMKSYDITKPRANQ